MQRRFSILSRLALPLVAVLLLGACSAAAAPGVPTPTPFPVATSAPAVPPPPTATARAALVATAAADLPAPHAVPLHSGDDVPLWAVFSTGERPFGGEHRLTLYGYEGGAWVALRDEPLPLPDLLTADSVYPVEVTPRGTWFVVAGALATGGGTFTLYQYDNAQLHSPVNTVAAVTPAATLRDLNGDSLPEVLLDESNPYVLCRACGIRDARLRVLRYHAGSFAPVELAPLAFGVPSAVREPLNEALRLAAADLWQPVPALLAAARSADRSDEHARWTLGVLEAQHTARRAAATGTPLPLLANALYGDFAAAEAVLREHAPAALFGYPSPAVEGTVAMGWEQELAAALTAQSNRAIAAQPDLAPAYAVRAFATFLISPASSAVLADMQRAAELQPDDTFYQESVAHLRDASRVPDPRRAILAAAEAYVREREAPQLTLALELQADGAGRVLLTRPRTTVPQRLFVVRQGSEWRVVATIEGERVNPLEAVNLAAAGVPPALYADMQAPPTPTPLPPTTTPAPATATTTATTPAPATATATGDVPPAATTPPESEERDVEPATGD